jgi:hypothetical protein
MKPDRFSGDQPRTAGEERHGSETAPLIVYAPGGIENGV